MAKPLSEKGRLIRAAIGKYPDKGNTELAEMLTKDDLEIKPADVAAQRTALKKAGEEAGRGVGTNVALTPPPNKQVDVSPPAPKGELSADDLLTLMSLAKKAGTATLRRYLDQLDGMGL